MSLPELKILGAERTGTNLLAFLLGKHYHVDILTSASSGLKHGPYTAANSTGLKRHVNVAICVKHPAAWIWSMYQFLYKREYDTFDQFLSAKGRQEAERWNQLYLGYLGLKPGDKRKSITRYEDMLVAPEKECSKAAAALGLERNAEPFSMPAKKMKKDNTVGEEPFDPTFYLERRYLGQYGPGALGAARGWFLPHAEAALGYDAGLWLV